MVVEREEVDASTSSTMTADFVAIKPMMMMTTTSNNNNNNNGNGKHVSFNLNEVKELEDMWTIEEDDFEQIWYNGNDIQSMTAGAMLDGRKIKFSSSLENAFFKCLEAGVDQDDIRTLLTLKQRKDMAHSGQRVCGLDKFAADATILRKKAELRHKAMQAVLTTQRAVFTTEQEKSDAIRQGSLQFTHPHHLFAQVLADANALATDEDHSHDDSLHAEPNTGGATQTSARRATAAAAAPHPSPRRHHTAAYLRTSVPAVLSTSSQAPSSPPPPPPPPPPIASPSLFGFGVAAKRALQSIPVTPSLWGSSSSSTTATPAQDAPEPTTTAPSAPSEELPEEEASTPATALPEPIAVVVAPTTTTTTPEPVSSPAAEANAEASGSSNKPTRKKAAYLIKPKFTSTAKKTAAAAAAVPTQTKSSFWFQTQSNGMT